MSGQDSLLFRAKLSTHLAFFATGFGLASWAPLIPFVKERAGLNDAQLGLLLLCLGIGSVIAMPLTGWLSARYGSKPMIIIGGLGFGLLFPFLVISHEPWALAATLLGLGACAGTLDVSMNVHAVEVERMAGKPIMSAFHGLFSVGGILGAGGVTLLLSLGLPPLICGFASGVIAFIAILFAWPRLLSARGEPVKLVMPHGVVVLLAILIAIMFLVEGAILDWGALLLIEMDLASAARGGLGYVVFSVAMTIGRLYGDAIVIKIGNKNTLVYGSLLAIFGFAVLLLSSHIIQAMLGFALIGFGSSNLVPVVFRLAGEQKIMPSTLAIAAVTTTGYAGILLGPALIGFISQVTSLKFSFIALAALTLLIPFASGRAIRPR